MSYVELGSLLEYKDARCYGLAIVTEVCHKSNPVVFVVEWIKTVKDGNEIDSTVERWAKHWNVHNLGAYLNVVSL